MSHIGFKIYELGSFVDISIHFLLKVVVDTGAPIKSKVSAPPAKKTKTAATSTEPGQHSEVTKKPPAKPQPAVSEARPKKPQEAPPKRQTPKPQTGGGQPVKSTATLKKDQGHSGQEKAASEGRRDKRKGAMNEFVQTDLDKGVADSGQEANVSENVTV